MADNRIELELVGITYNQIESGVYAVILKQKEGTRRIPIIIGSSEAQSIECKLQGVVTPRPLTHDLMVNVMRAYGLALNEIVLRRLPSGVFAADLRLTDGTRELTIDSRSSDAIALAVRMGASIYTSQEVLEEAGFEPEANPSRPAEPLKGAKKENDISRMSVAELKKAMAKAVEVENYEEASRIKKEIESRENK